MTLEHTIASHPPQDDLQARIDAIIDERSARAKEVDVQLRAVEGLGAQLRGLQQQLSVLMADNTVPQALTDGLSHLEGGRHTLALEEVQQQLGRVQARMQRKTINVGVSGAARMGKSTLLQVLSNLSDDQIPTGDALCVTAVRSRIHHQPDAKPGYAELEFHTYASFREDVLQPLYAQAGLGDAPSTLAGFRALGQTDHAAPRNATSNTNYQRLMDCWRWLPDYEALLESPERHRKVTIQENVLKQFVAYPDSREKQDPTFKKYHPAVKTANIYCCFPKGGISNLLLIDLPGLGEVDGGRAAAHIRRLYDEVDVALFIKRPTEASTDVMQVDTQTLDLLEEACLPKNRQSDFIFVVSNEGRSASTGEASHAHRVEEMNNQLRHLIGAKGYRFLSWRHRDTAFHDVLSPVTEHLASHLRLIDRELYDEVMRRSRSTLDGVGAYLDAVSGLLSRHLSSSVDHGLRDDVHALQAKLSQALRRYIQEFSRATAGGQANENTFVVSINALFAEFEEQLRNGLWITNMEAWHRRAQERLDVDSDFQRFGYDEMERLRGHIRDHFARIDEHVTLNTRRVQDQVGEIIKQEMGDLLRAYDGKNCLEALEAMCAQQGLTSLRNALQRLNHFEISHSAHVLPHLAHCLRHLKTMPESKDTSPVVFSAHGGANGSQAIYGQLTAVAGRVGGEIRDALMKEANKPYEILRTALEQFEDGFIRAGLAKEEFVVLAAPVRGQIWQHYQAIELRQARRREVETTLRNATEQLKRL